MLRTVCVSLMVATLALAQGRGGGGRGGGGGGARGGPAVGPVGQGFGNVVFPGTGIPQIQGGHAVNLGRAIRGVPPVNPSPHQRGGRGIYPIAVPVYVSPWGYGGYGYGPDPSAVTVVSAPQPAPTVVINQNWLPERANPVMRDYTNEQLPEPAGDTIRSYQAPIPSNPDPPSRTVAEAKPTIYLIALREGVVYSAFAYWVEGTTLHYITTKHAHNQVSVDLVDREVSEQLNRERNVEFKLKP